MFKKALAMALTGLLLQVICTQSTFAKSSDKEQVKFAEKVKTNILKLGVGQDARVEVKLRDKTKMAGYISEVNADSFMVTDLKTSSTTTIAYMDVAQVKGHNLSPGAWIAIGIGIGVGVIFLILAILGATGYLG